MKFCPHTLIKLCRECGFVLENEAGLLMVSPASKLTPEMRDALRRHKSDLLPLIPENQQP